MRQAAARLAALGAEVIELSIPLHRQGHAIWTPIAVEGSTQQMKGYNYGSNWKGLYVTSLMQAQRHWRDHADEFPHDVKTCLLAGEYFHARYGGQYYAKAQNLARRLGHAYDTALTRVDALLMPTVPMRAPRLIDAGAAPDLHVTRALEMNANTAPFDVTGPRHVRALRITRRPAGGHDADRPPLRRGHAVPRRARLRARARLDRAVSARDGHRVGLLFSRESLTAATEITQENATRMAIDEVNAAGGIDGVPLTPISAGVGAQPPDYRQAAEWLCDAQRVPLIFGSHMSSTRKAVLPVVESRRALLFYATLYEGFEYSPNCFYTGSVPNQNSVQLASYVIRHFGNRVLFIGGSTSTLANRTASCASFTSRRAARWWRKPTCR